MRLLVTRPEPDATRTAARLEAIGHRVWVEPLLTVAFNPPPQRLPAPGALLVTSQNAVRALQSWPQAAEWRDVPVFPAGPTTARALRDLGFTDVRSGATDAASLAEVVLRTLNTDTGPLVYPAARDRTGGLAGGLTAAGFDVRLVEAYRAEPVAALSPPVRAALDAAEIDGILLYSARTARALIEVAGRAGIAGALHHPACFVISPHVAEVVAGLGGPLHIADHPDEDSLFALVSAAG